MVESEKQQSNGLAIASFVLALVGGFLCLTIIGGILGIICWILAIIFGIIALCKKQIKWASIIGIVISVLGIIITIIATTLLGKFVVQHKDEFMTPISEFSARVEENPEIAELMNDEDFNNKFQEALQQRLQEKYGEDYSNITSIDGALNVWGDMFEEMKNVATELAEQNGINMENLENEEIPEEIVGEEVVEVEPGTDGEVLDTLIENL